jgi:hypothetical protein
MNETPRRFIRVPDSIWNRANAKAKAQDKTISYVIRALLVAYVNGQIGPRQETPSLRAETL